MAGGQPGNVIYAICMNVAFIPSFFYSLMIGTDVLYVFPQVRVVMIIFVFCLFSALSPFGTKTTMTIFDNLKSLLRGRLPVVGGLDKEAPS